MSSAYEFWNRASCGERLFLGNDEYDTQGEARYQLEPFIPEFARFDQSYGKKVLEVGVGLGADHEQFAAAGAILTGIDLTPRAIEHSEIRLARRGLRSRLQVANAENLPFDDGVFDIVYSWGVIHHADSPARCAKELLRVLRPGGRYAVMVYRKWSFVGLMLWLRYGRTKSLNQVYAEHLESPGTKAFTNAGARALFPGCRIRTELSSGDLLVGGAGQRHEGRILRAARKIWPRGLIRRLPRFGLFMLIDGIKE